MPKKLVKMKYKAPAKKKQKKLASGMIPIKPPEGWKKKTHLVGGGVADEAPAKKKVVAKKKKNKVVKRALSKMKSNAASRSKKKEDDMDKKFHDLRAARNSDRQAWDIAVDNLSKMYSGKKKK